MRRRNKSLYLLILSAAILAALAATAWFLYDNIGNISAVLKNAESKTVLLESKEREFSKLASDVKSSEQQIEKINSVFLNEETFVTFVELLESLARETGVKIKAESAGLPASGAGQAEVYFSLDGTFTQIMKFIVLLDKIPVAGIANSVEITKKESKSDEKVPSDVLFAKINYVIFGFKNKTIKTNEL